MTITVAGGNVTITYAVTAAKASAILSAAAHQIWDSGRGDHGTPEAPIAFDSLTNAQKLALVDERIKQFVVTMAKSYSVDAAVEAARSTASADADLNLNL